MIYLLISNVITIIAFIIGVRIGQKVRNNEKIEVKIPSIKKKIIEHNIEVAQAKEVEKLNTIINNIENYNGTAQGQAKIK